MLGVLIASPTSAEQKEDNYTNSFENILGGGIFPKAVSKQTNKVICCSFRKISQPNKTRVHLNVTIILKTALKSSLLIRRLPTCHAE